MNIEARTAPEVQWSYSKLKNFENCPKKYYEVDVSKNFKEQTQELAEGDATHKALAIHAKSGAPLEGIYAPYNHWLHGTNARDYGPTRDGMLTLPGEILVEQKFAITRDFRPTPFFSKAVWMRGIGDILRIDGPVAHYRDYKTGKLRHDATQLVLAAQMVFSHYPSVRRVLCQFVWLQDDTVTSETLSRDGVVEAWGPILDRYHALNHAHVTSSFPPKPGKLCARYCPVNSCPHHGKHP